MKTRLILFIGCATFLRLARSQGHHDHLKHHHAKRQDVCSDVVTDVVTDIDYVTYDSEDVIVYVNDANQPVSTTTVSTTFERLLPFNAISESQALSLEEMMLPAPQVCFPAKMIFLKRPIVI